MHIARRQQSILLEELNGILGRLNPAVLRIDTRGADLLAVVEEMEANGGLVLVGGSLTGWNSGWAAEMSEVFSACGVLPGHLRTAFKRAQWEPKMKDRANAD